MLPLLRRYVPRSVASNLQEGVHDDIELSELRQVSVMFINCAGLRLAPSDSGGGGGRSQAPRGRVSPQPRCLGAREAVHAPAFEEEKL